MLSKLLTYLKKLAQSTGERGGSTEVEEPLSRSLSANVKQLESMFESASDFCLNEFRLGGSSLRVAAVYLDGMVDAARVEESLIEPLMVWSRPEQGGYKSSAHDVLDSIQSDFLPARKLERAGTLDEVTDAILDGDIVFLVDGAGEALINEAKEFEIRGIEEPASEVALRGTREGFVDNAAVNVTLIRRRLKTPRLKVQQMRLGRKSQTDVRMVYVDEVAQKDLVDEVHRRLQAIDIDMVSNSRVVQDLIADNPYSIFPCMQGTERPDSVVYSLAEGRVAVIVDNDPFVLILPMEFFSFFATAEHYNLNFYVANLLRIISIASFVLSVILTPIYVAMTTFHQELIPMPLLLNIAAVEAGIPMQVSLTAFVVEIVLEIIREAGSRLPRPVGQAAGIVGAVVLGQAAIEAGFVSPGLVIVAATATIASFAVPHFEATTSWRLLRFPILLAASIMGFYGVTISLILMLFHMCSLKAFGIPFLSLYSPGRVSELADKMFVAPARQRRRVRPAALRDRQRISDPPATRDPDSGSRNIEERLR